MNSLWGLELRALPIRALEMCTTHGYRDLSGPQYYLWFFDTLTASVETFYYGRLA